MTVTRTTGLPPRVRPDFARALPDTADREARTIEVTWATGATARQVDPWTGETFEEELDMAGAQLDVLNRGAPLLNAHSRYELGNVIGVVERAWLDNSEGRALVRFSERTDVAPIMADVMDGILRNLSVGYRVAKYQVEQRNDGPTLYRAVDWTPFEISFVPVGADPAAQVRSSTREPQPCVFVFPDEDTAMDKTVAPSSVTAEPVVTEQTRQADERVAQARAEAQEAERKRGLEITQRCRALNLSDEFRDKLIADGKSLADAYPLIIDEMARGAQSPTRPPAIARGSDETKDSPTFVRAAMVEAMAHNCVVRSGIGVRAGTELTDRAREYAEISSPLQMLAEFARSQGAKIKPFLSNMALYDELLTLRMHTTSDFPALLGSTINRVFLAAYGYQAPMFREVFSMRSFRDFRPTSFLRLGDFPLLEEKAEAAEYTHGTISESSNAISAKEYGRMIAISRKALINDDLGAFATLPTLAGRRVAQWENQTAWALLALNGGGGPTVTDPAVSNNAAVNLFHASHNNLIATGTAISVASLSTARAMMRKQVGLDGAKLNLTPMILVVSPDAETVAQQVLNSTIVPTTDGTTNPFKGSLKIVVDAELTGLAWYLFADPMAAPALIYGYVDGQTGPQIASDSPFDTNGLRMRVIEDFAVGAIDFRGVLKNNGA